MNNFLFWLQNIFEAFLIVFMIIIYILFLIFFRLNPKLKLLAMCLQLEWKKWRQSQPVMLLC